MSTMQRLKKNKLLILVAAIYMVLYILRKDQAIAAIKNSMYYVIEMLEIMPVIFILTSLIEAWVPREVIMKNFGKESGAKGTLFSFVLGSFSAGPVYAAFPVCKTLARKGASISNIIIILSAWAVIKVPMLVNESKFLGTKFMTVRWIATTLAILLISYAIALFVKREDLPDLEEIQTTPDEATDVIVMKEYCISCGVCTRISPENFLLQEGKATIISKESMEEKIEKIISKCPTNAIRLVKQQEV